MGTWLCITIGFLLNMLGLGMTVHSLFTESRARHLGDLPGEAQVRAVRRSLRRLLGRDRELTTVIGSRATGWATGTLTVQGEGYGIHPVDPDAPAHEQVKALERNLTAMIDSHVRGWNARAEQHEAQMDQLGTRIDGLHQTMSENEAEEAAVARQSIHTELVGVTIAIAGTLLGSLPSLWQSWPWK